MGKVSALRKGIQSPHWRVSQYEYRVSPKLSFTLTLGQYPYAMANVGHPSEPSYACYMVLPLCTSRSEQPFAVECERLAAQHPGVSALLSFFWRSHEDR